MTSIEVLLAQMVAPRPGLNEKGEHRHLASFLHEPKEHLCFLAFHDTLLAEIVSLMRRIDCLWQRYKK